MKKYKIIYFKVVFNFFIECNFCGSRTSNPTYPPLDGPALTQSKNFTYTFYFATF